MSALAALKDVLDDNPVVGEQRKGSRRYWTGREEKILRDNYPTVGVAGCLELLPGRTASAIYGHAGSLGVKGPVASKPDFRRQVWTTNDAIDATIRRLYPQCTTKNAVVELAKKINRPRWWTSKRAVKLGLVAPRFKQPDWSEAEDELLNEHGHKNPETIRRIFARKGFQRSTTAIIVRMKRTEVDRVDPNHYTARGLSRLLGVDATTIGHWIAKGWLKAKPRGTARTAQQGGDQWWIHRRDVRTFIVDNVAAVDIRKVDKFWFIDLLVGRHET